MAAVRGGLGKAIIDLIRVRQWYKNILVFSPLVFADLLGDISKVWATVLAFLAFCTISSCLYVFNDISDINQDRLHPKKRNRPLPSGRISWREAILLGILLFGITAGLCSLLPSHIWLIIGGYVLMNLAYTKYLKHLFIIDIFTIGFGFIFRVLAGCAAVGVILSPWLFSATFLLAILLGFSKRASELNCMENAQNHRSVLSQYDPTMLKAFILISATSVLIVYLIYAIIIVKSPYFIITTPFVLYGIFRYISLSIHTGCDPDDMIKDRAFVANLLLWGLVVGVVLYAH